MSGDIKERLRRVARLNTYSLSGLEAEAAATIERLEAERDALVSARDMMGNKWAAEQARAVDAEARVAALEERVAELEAEVACDDGIIAARDARVAAMTEALKPFVGLLNALEEQGPRGTWMGTEFDTFRDIEIHDWKGRKPPRELPDDLDVISVQIEVPGGVSINPITVGDLRRVRALLQKTTDKST